LESASKGGAYRFCGRQSHDSKQILIKAEDDNDALHDTIMHPSNVIAENVVSSKVQTGGEGDGKTQDTLRYITTFFQSFELHQRCIMMSVTPGQKADKTHT